MDDWKPNFINPEEIEKRNDINTERLVQSYSEGGEQTKFYFVKSEIEALLGVELTTIELVGLKKIIEEVSREATENNKQVTTNHSAIFDLTEIQARFLLNFYGISSYKELREAFPPEKDKDGKETWPTQMMHEFFQREQAKLHNEL